MPNFFLVAGPNGVGKSSNCRYFLPKDCVIIDYDYIYGACYRKLDMTMQKMERHETASSGTALSESACLQAMAFNIYLRCHTKNTYQVPRVSCGSIQERRAEMEDEVGSTNTITKSGSWLGDPIPNPAKETVSLNYTVPKGKTGKLVVYDLLRATEMETIVLREGVGNVSLNLNNYTTGIYAAKLMVDDNLITTKKISVLK
jgi:hypothetical protein